MTKYPTIELPLTPEFEHLNFDDFLKLTEVNFSSNYFSSEQYDQPVFRKVISSQSIPIFQHAECVCPDCEIVSWIQITNNFIWEDQPFCPSCRKQLRSDIDSVDKLLCISEEETEKYWNSSRSNDFPFLNSLHV